VARHNVQVNAIAPGWFPGHDQRRRSATGDHQRLTRDVPARRIGGRRRSGRSRSTLLPRARIHDGPDALPRRRPLGCLSCRSVGRRVIVRDESGDPPWAARSSRRERARASAGPGRGHCPVAAAGLCGTDYEIWSGARPVAVSASDGPRARSARRSHRGDVTRVGVGDPVVVRANYSVRAVSALSRGQSQPLPVANHDRHQRRWRLRRARPRARAVLAGAPSRTGADRLLLAEPLASSSARWGAGPRARRDRASWVRARSGSWPSRCFARAGRGLWS